MTTDLRAAAQSALELLKELGNNVSDDQASVVNDVCLALNNALNEVSCFSGVVRKQADLEAAFKSVQRPENWKLPVSAVIPITADLSLILDAIVHFTGSVPDFKYKPDLDHPRVGGEYIVTADGYYKTIGA